VSDVSIQVRIHTWLEYVLQNPELGLFLGSEAFRIIQYFAVAVA
jgi:hypothetical protein